METNRRLGISLGFPPFPAFRVGKETEAALIRAFHQRHADAGLARQGRSGQGGSVGVIEFGSLRLLEPQAEKSEGITILLRVGVVRICGSLVVVTYPHEDEIHGS